MNPQPFSCPIEENGRYTASNDRGKFGANVKGDMREKLSMQEGVRIGLPCRAGPIRLIGKRFPDRNSRQIV